MTDKGNSLENTLNFLDEVKNALSITLELGNLTGNQKKIMYDKHNKDNIEKIRKKYSNLEEPEKVYLRSLERRYFNDFLSKFSEEELEILDTPLNDLDMSVRLHNSLRRFSGGKEGTKIYYGEIIEYKVTDLMKQRDFGKKSLNELENLVEEKGYKLGQEIKYISPENR